MASSNAFLANWLKGAYGMELGLAPMLEEQASRLDDDTNLHKSLRGHLEQTRRHAALLRERLERMGEDTSGIGPIPPVTAPIGRANGGKPDTARQTELLDYVTESFEVASYRGLQSLAEILGDAETSRICEQILADEVAATDILSRRLPAQNGHNNSRAAVTDGNAAPAREVFAAINAHDMDHLAKLVADDYRVELPGSARPVTWAESRTWFEALFRAMPDLHYQLERVASSGDSTFAEWTATGTHSGTFELIRGQAFPATNKRVSFTGVTILRFKADKIVHTRVITDSALFLRQLGTVAAGSVPAAGSIAADSTSAPESAARSIVHLEIPALDRRIAARFYGQLFGWDYEHMDDPVNYTTFQSGTVRGGFPEVSDLNPAGEVLFYVYSDNIEADLRHAERLGGKTLVPRTAIPGVGYYAILADPTGNRFGLYYRNQPA